MTENDTISSPDYDKITTGFSSLQLGRSDCPAAALIIWACPEWAQIVAPEPFQ